MKAKYSNVTIVTTSDGRVIVLCAEGMTRIFYNLTPNLSAIALIDFISAQTPAKCTGIITFGRRPFFGQILIFHAAHLGTSSNFEHQFQQNQHLPQINRTICTGYKCIRNGPNQVSFTNSARCRQRVEQRLHC